MGIVAEEVCISVYFEGLINRRFAPAALQRGPRFLSDEEVMNLVSSRNILNYKLESALETPERGVAIRREMLSPKLPVRSALAALPYKDYDYSKVAYMQTQGKCTLKGLCNQI